MYCLNLTVGVANPYSSFLPEIDDEGRTRQRIVTYPSTLYLFIFQLGKTMKPALVLFFYVFWNVKECQFLSFNPYIFNVCSGKCSVHSQMDKSMALLLNSRSSPFTSVVNYGRPGEMFTKRQFDYQQVSLTILTCEGHTIVTYRISISRRGKAEE